jgi:hypothetical protein
VKPVQRTNRNTERLVSWRSKWLLLFTLFLMMQQGAVVSAHMTVEDRFYEDVVYSKSMEQIVLLRSLNVISADSYVSLFMPQEKLTRADLALWSANFRRLAESGSKPEQWRQAAMEHRLVASLDGYATYRDINQAYFDGKAPAPDNPDAEPTREQFAVYMGQFLTDAVDGKTLYVLAGMTPGPTGVIDKVAKRRGVPAMEDSQQFDLIVAGRSYSLSMHAVMLYEEFDRFIAQPVARKYPAIRIRKLVKPITEKTHNEFKKNGIVPDVILTTSSALLDLKPLGYLSDIGPLLATSGFDLGRLELNAVESVKVASGQEVLVGIPFIRQFNALYYNKDIFNKFNVPYPNDGMTWREAAALAARVTNKDGETQFRGLEPDIVVRPASALRVYLIRSSRFTAFPETKG